jgi:hypothetical protein
MRCRFCGQPDESGECDRCTSRMAGARIRPLPPEEEPGGCRWQPHAPNGDPQEEHDNE